MQDALEVGIAHPDLFHVIDGIADVIDAKAPLPHPLRHQPRPTVQVQLPHVCGVRRIGEEGERADLPAGAQLDLKQARRVHPPGHLALPEAR